jgi:hypothetical protein
MQTEKSQRIRQTKQQTDMTKQNAELAFAHSHVFGERKIHREDEINECGNETLWDNGGREVLIRQRDCKT